MNTLSCRITALCEDDEIRIYFTYAPGHAATHDEPCDEGEIEFTHAEYIERDTKKWVRASAGGYYAGWAEGYLYDHPDEAFDEIAEQAAIARDDADEARYQALRDREIDA